MPKGKSKNSKASEKGHTANKTTATQILREDHLKIRDFFEDFEDTEDPQMLQEIRELLLAEIRVHKAVLEDLFYPAVEEIVGDELMEDARNDMETWDSLMENLERIDPEDSTFRESWQKLLREMNHHISWEEQEMLNKIEEKNLDMTALGLKMAELKKEILAEQPTSSWESTRERGDY